MTAPKHCCDSMRRQLEHNCVKCMGQYACPDRVIKPPSAPGAAFGLYILDGGSSYYAIYFCPWCGARLASWGGASQQGQQNKENENMTEEAQKFADDRISDYRNVLKYRTNEVELKLPGRGYLIFNRAELVTIAMAVFQLLRDRFYDKIHEAILGGLNVLARQTWRATPAEIREASHLLHVDLAEAKCAAYEMVGCTATELVVYYNDRPPEATIKAFVNSIPPSYRGVPVITKRV